MTVPSPETQNATTLLIRPCIVMLLLPLFVSLLFAPQNSQQNQSIFQRVVARPDPKNGYEDYVRACDLVKGSMLDEYLSWTPDRYNELANTKQLAARGGDPRIRWQSTDEARLATEESLRGQDYLGVQRAMVKKFGGVLELIRKGDTKQVWDPRDKVTVDTIFPEQSFFRSIPKLFRAAAYVRFADGDTLGGTSDLIDSLTFARKIGGGNLLSALISGQCQQTAFAAFEDHLAQLSERDAIMIVNYADAALTENASYLQALVRERTQLLDSVDLLLESPDKYLLSNPPNPTRREAAVAKSVRALSASDRRLVRDQLASGIDLSYGKVVSQIGLEESSWTEKRVDLPEDPRMISSPRDVSDALLNMVMPAFDRLTVAVMRTRAQLRLLDLHARIIAFKWHLNRLPKNLNEAAPEQLIYDPLSKTAFEYELQAGGYRLYSKGVPSTGVIELQYRRPASIPKENDPIPPVDGVIWVHR